MSFREVIKETFKDIKKEYDNIQTTDKILDGISILGVLFFFISIIVIQLSEKLNAVNIAFSIYPIAIAGISTTFRMKRRDEENIKTKDMFREYVIIVSAITLIVVLAVIITLVLYG